jgi:NAD(P)-dependent dehydrogenase (short-subunit alcohol dehydrogenase family)
MHDTVVITGVGGMGLACARRLGSGRRLLLADFNTELLEAAAEELSGQGFNLATRRLDVADPEAVLALAAAVEGRCRAIVHTAGVSPTMARSDRIYAVDLLGTAHVLDAFLPIATTGTVAVMIASMAAEIAGLTPEQEQQLATAPTPELLSLVAELPQSKDAGAAYCVAKRGNQLRVQAAAPVWGKRGARVVSISPGIISTPMGLLEMNQPMVAELLKITPAGRSGTAEDIAAAAAWLISDEASFVTGMDLRVDGGAISAQRWPAKG